MESSFFSCSTTLPGSLRYPVNKTPSRSPWKPGNRKRYENRPLLKCVVIFEGAEDGKFFGWAAVDFTMMVAQNFFLPSSDKMIKQEAAAEEEAEKEKEIDRVIFAPNGIPYFVFQSADVMRSEVIIQIPQHFRISRSITEIFERQQSLFQEHAQKLYILFHSAFGVPWEIIIKIMSYLKQPLQINLCSASNYNDRKIFLDQLHHYLSEFVYLETKYK